MAGSGQQECLCVHACLCIHACVRGVSVCECRVNCRLGGATHCLPYLWSRVEPLGERWSWWHVVPVTGRLAPDSSRLPLKLWEPAERPLDRHRDAGTAFILGGGLVPDTLSALPPTFTHHRPPLPTLSTHTQTPHRQHTQPIRMLLLVFGESSQIDGNWQSDADSFKGAVHGKNSPARFSQAVACYDLSTPSLSVTHNSFMGIKKNVMHG